MRLSINFASMADFDYRDCFRFVVNFINQSVGPNSDSPGPLGTFHQLATYWSGIVAEGDQLFFKSFRRRERKRHQALFGPYAESLPRSSLAAAANFVKSLFQWNCNFAGSFRFVVLANRFQILELLEEFFILLDVKDDCDG